MARRAKIKAEARKHKNSARGAIDYPFLILVIVLMGIGLLMLFSASYASAYYDNNINDSTYYFIRQGTFAIIGIAIMLGISFFDYRYFRPLAPIFMAVTIVLLVLVLFIGKGNYVETRWIKIGSFSFQPSELAKTAVIFLFSAMISKNSDKMKTFRYGVLPYILILGVIAVLMFLEPHLSGLILIVAIGVALMFIGGTQLKWFIGSISVIGVAGIAAISFWPYAKQRIATYFDPFADPTGKGYQIIQSLYAIGSGGALGLGFGNSRQKFLYLPEAHNDFIFAIVCEELGFIGAIIILALFAALIYRGYWIAMNARDKFGSLLVAGITTKVALQTILNISVVTKILPVTGASLPFFSYGGTALVILLAEMGVVLSVSRYIPAKKAG